KPLRINDDEVEYWIVKAISSKILDCKVDQLNQLVIVSRHTARVFGMPQWQSLRSKLGVWRGNIANAINTIQANKVTEDGGQGMQGLMIR
uniref:PCI domain-containing protein n=1 Tax=Aegilops tauschii subsp. strangulata TaxID=200361 RepID=A0A453AC12_AEGTS